MTFDEAPAAAPNVVDPSTLRRFRAIVTFGTAGAAVLAVAGLLAYAPGLRMLGSYRADYIPMAPSTALSFLILGTVLFVQSRNPWHGAARPVALTSVLLVTLFSLLVWLGSVLGLDLSFQARFTRGFGTLGTIPLGRMSPATGVAIMMTGLGTLLLSTRRAGEHQPDRAGHVASSLGVLAALVGATVALAYLYGTPLMYGGTAVPMAVTTAIAAVCLGAALAAASGPESFPLRLVVGTSTPARLSRVFLPLTVVVVFIDDLVSRLNTRWLDRNDTLLTALLAIGVGVITVALVARISHVTGTSLDQRTRQLEESEARNRAITQSASDAIITTDSAGNIVDWNFGAERIFGFIEAEIIGRSIAVVMPEEFRIGHSTGMHRVVSGGDPRVLGKTVELTGLRKDGTAFPLDLSLARWTRAGEQYFTGIIRDVSERRRAAGERAAMQERLAQLQKMESIGLLAGGVAHEFNNLLSAILGYAELATLELGAGHVAQPYLQAIRNSAERSADLTARLLAFARQRTITPRVHDLDTTVARSVEMLRPTLEEHMALAWMPDGEGCLVKADPTQIDQALTNLALNARAARRGNDARLVISTAHVVLDSTFVASHTSARTGEFVRVRVQDNGCGMDTATLSRLFEPFFTTKPPGQGTGLGLSTVYGIMQQHQGFIDVESEPGSGSRFDLYFPRSTAPAEEISSPKPTLRRGSGTILLTEDEEGVRTSTAEMLRMLGYSVLPACDAEEAASLVDGHAAPIHLLITDVIMPGMNGLQLANALRARRPGLRVLFMSGHAGDVLSTAGMLTPGTVCLRKPFTMLALADAVGKALDG